MIIGKSKSEVEGDKTDKNDGEKCPTLNERGKEHSSDFVRLVDRSHLLRHYVLKHQDIRIDELEFGMKIRSSFRTAIERQVGEAIAISREQRKGTTLLNSKAEYNRCKISRLDTRTETEKLKESSAENEIENKVKEVIKSMQKTKRNRSKESTRRTREMRDACIEIQNENIVSWNKRRKLQEKKEKNKWNAWKLKV